MKSALMCGLFLPMSLDDELRGELQAREVAGLKRELRVMPPGVLDLASNDYLGLSRHPDVVEGARRAAQEFGAGARASRLVSGHTALHEKLEVALANWKGYEAALVFSSGYAANLAVVTSLARAGDDVFCDKRNHASLIDACRLAESNRARVRFYHSPDKLRALLQASRAPRRLIVSDTVYSMDGDLAPLSELAELAQRFDAVLILDDAHGTGTLPTANCQPPTLLIGTLSKALGSQGGFVCASRAVCDWLVNVARSFIYTTGLNPPACGAALAALNVLQHEPGRVTRLHEVKRQLANGLRDLGFDVRPQPSPILPVIIGDATRALGLSQALLSRGVWCPAIRPPTVSANTSRLRVTATASLSDADIARALKAFQDARRMTNDQ